MNHIPFEFICRIADGDSLQSHAEYSAHLVLCKVCQREVELQRTILTSAHKVQLINPSQNFTRNLLDSLGPKKKHWYEEILQNMGNVIAMISVLAFLAYTFSVVSSAGIQIDKPTDSKLASEILKYMAMGIDKITDFLAPKAIIAKPGEAHPNALIFGFIAIALLIFIDKVAQRLFRHSRI